MNDKEKNLAASIMDAIVQLPETRKIQLLGIAQGMELAANPEYMPIAT